MTEQRRERFALQDMERRGLDEFVEFSCVDTGNIRPFDLSENTEWRLEACIAIHFWANRAQLPEARKTALKAVYAGIYQEILRELPRLRLAISDGSKQRAREICDRMETLMKEPQP